MDRWARVEGTVTFSRSDDKEPPCICCPDGHHVYAYGLELDGGGVYPGRWRYRGGTATPGEFIHDSIVYRRDWIEGRRVRITFEVLDPDEGGT